MKDPERRKRYDEEHQGLFTPTLAPDPTPPSTSANGHPQPATTLVINKASSVAFEDLQKTIESVRKQLNTDLNWITSRLDKLQDFVSNNEHVATSEHEAQIIILEEHKESFVEFLRVLRCAHENIYITRERNLGHPSSTLEEREDEMAGAERYYEQQYSHQVSRERWYWDAISKKCRSFPLNEYEPQAYDKTEKTRQLFSAIAVEDQALLQHGQAFSACVMIHTCDYSIRIEATKQCKLCKNYRKLFFKCTICGKRMCQQCCWKT